MGDGGLGFGQGKGVTRFRAPFGDKFPDRLNACGRLCLADELSRREGCAALALALSRSALRSACRSALSLASRASRAALIGVCSRTAGPEPGEQSSLGHATPHAVDGYGP
jgi:hypothetical protein